MVPLPLLRRPVTLAAWIFDGCHIVTDEENSAGGTQGSNEFMAVAAVIKTDETTGPAHNSAWRNCKAFRAGSVTDSKPSGWCKAFCCLVLTSIGAHSVG
jgi:hypothetical protein